MALVILKTRARTTMGINLREKLASTFHTIFYLEKIPTYDILNRIMEKIRITSHRAGNA